MLSLVSYVLLITIILTKISTDHAWSLTNLFFKTVMIALRNKAPKAEDQHSLTLLVVFYFDVGDLHDPNLSDSIRGTCV